MPPLPWLRPAVSFAVSSLLLLALRLLPTSSLNDGGQVAVEAVRVVLALLLLLSLLGWSFSPILLPDRWKTYESILMPLLGVAVFVPLAYLLNFSLDMRSATVVLIVVALPLATLRLVRGPLPAFDRKDTPVVLAALGLLVVALLPHLVQSSLGLLSQSVDEETYFYLANYLLAYPAGAGMPGPPSPVFGQGTDFYRAEGWGYMYLLAAASGLSGVPTFDAYLPTSYVLLALSVPSWFLFFRAVLRLEPSSARLAALLYAAHGLPLWFASYGYARQAAWIALAPLALSALALGLNRAGARGVAFAGLALGALFATESRVGATHIAVTVAGLGVFWLVFDRRLAFMKRISGMGIVAALAAAPALWFFVRSYLVGGEGVAILNARDSRLLDWGPNLGGFPGPEVLLGLEPFDLVKLPEGSTQLQWLDPIGGWMSNAAPCLAWVLLVVAAFGAVVASRRNPLLLPLVAGFFIWMAVTRTVLPFPYGYFKLFGVAAPIVLGFIVAGTSARPRLPKLGRLSIASLVLRQGERGTPRHAERSEATPRCESRPLADAQDGSHQNHSDGLRWARRNLLTLGCAVLLLFLARNTLSTVVFGAGGWGLSIPPSLVSAVSAFSDATEPGAHVYVTGATRYPVDRDAVLLRKGHRLAMQSREELEMVWADRMHALVSTSLVGRQIHGVFKTEQWRWSSVLPDDDYDYYVLNSDEDPRLRGLDRSDVVVNGGSVALYRVPGEARASSEQILSARGSLRVDASSPLEFRAERGRLVLSPDGTERDGVAQGRIRLGFLALRETILDLSIDGFHRLIALDPGVSWYTSPTLDLPCDVTVRPIADDAVRVVALRVLPPGEEDLDRSDDSYLSSEVAIRDGNVCVDIWLGNPMRDAKGAHAEVVVDGNESTGRRLGLEVDKPGQRWSLRFPLQGGASQQLRDGVMAVPIEPSPWLEGGGGLLSLRFRLGHERPKEALIATISVNMGTVTRLDRYVDPVQLRLWGHDDRPKEKAPPPLESLEGALVRAPGGVTYLVQDGRRRWVPNPGSYNGSRDPIELSSEQLWLIPPGLPLE